MKRTILTTGILVITMMGMPALGQERHPDRGPRTQQPPRLTPEQAQAVWQIQAEGVAKRLGFGEEKTEVLVSSYLTSRENFARASRKMRENARDRRGDEGGFGGDRRGRGGNAQALLNRELISAERQKFATALENVLSQGQVKKVMSSLGSPNRRWDLMVHVLKGYELSAENAAAAYEHVEDFVLATSKVRPGDKRINREDREAMANTMKAAEDTLREKLSTILDEKQMKRLARAMSPPRGRQDGMMDRLKKLDTNGDGKLQESEVPERMLRFFGRLDTNGDGEIDREEIKAMMDRRRDRGDHEGRGRRGGRGESGGRDGGPF